MKKRPIDHISTLAKEEKLELEMMKMLFSKNKQKKKFKDGSHIISDPESGSTILKEHYKNGKRDGFLEFFMIMVKFVCRVNISKEKERDFTKCFMKTGNFGIPESL